MRVDVDTYIQGSAVSNGGFLSMILDVSGAEYVMVGISVIGGGLTGSPTTVRFELAPTNNQIGSLFFNSGDVLGTNDLTGTPVATPFSTMFTRVGPAGAAKTTILAEAYMLPPMMKYFAITATLTGGASPTIASGALTLYVWKFIR